MKLIVQLLVIVAMSTTLEASKFLITGSGTLAKNLQNIVDRIPVDKVLQLIRAYAIKDREFQISMYVINMKDTSSFVAQQPHISGMMSLAKDSGLDINSLVEQLVMYAYTVFAEQPSESELQITGGLAGFDKDLRALVSVEELSVLTNKKQTACDTFTSYYNTTMNEEYITSIFPAPVENYLNATVEIAETFGLDGKLFEQYLPLFLILKILYV